MDVQTLKNFVLVSETLNFTKSASQINIVQPALSRQIQNLELELDVKLFVRSNRTVKLTDAGIFYAMEVKNILAMLQKAQHEVKLIESGQKGQLRIGHSSSVMHRFLPLFLKKMGEKLPKISITLLEEGNKDIIEKIEKNELDMGFGPNMLTPDHFEMIRIYEENFILILPQSHPLDASNFRDLSQVRNENFILPPIQMGKGYVESIINACMKYDFIPKILHESANSSTVLRLVEAGMGITIEPFSTIKGYSLDLKYIELKGTTSSMNMIFKKERKKEFMAYLTIIEGLITSLPK